MGRDDLLLTLSVSTFKGVPSASPVSKEFSTNGGTVGRLPTNDLILSDARRVISGCHARIRFEDDGYVLDDVSTNGVFLNGAADPIGRGNSVRLTHGDMLKMGDYDLRVDIVATAGADEDPFLPPPSRPELDDSFAAFAPSSRGTGESFDPMETPNPPRMRGDHALGIPDDLDPLDLLDAPPPLPPPTGESRSDHLPAENFSFRPPRAVPQSIPDDWDKSGSWPPPAPPAARTPEPMAEPAPPPEPPVRRAEPAGAPARADSDPSGASTLRALLSACGLPADRLGERSADDVVHDAGTILRAVVAGVMELLAERAAFKGEFRVEQTTIRPMENNPLKFARGAEDALRHMLFPSDYGFLGGEDAVRQGVQDLKDHRVALLAAMRTAFESLVAHFDPERLESAFEEQGKKSSMLQLGTKGRAWTMYREYYEELKHDPDRLFREVINEVFARAYESQVALLARKRG